MLGAYKLIQRNFPELRLVHIGHCSGADFKIWKSFFNAIPNAELRKPIQYDKVADEMSGCRIMVHPSRSEAMGRVLIEAMASARPVVATRVGGIPNLIRDGVEGILVEPNDVDGLAHALRKLLSDATLRRRLGKAGAERVRTVLSERSYVEAYTYMLGYLDDPIRNRRRGIVFDGFMKSPRINSFSRL